MIQSKPHQDDAAFPPFTYEDMSLDSIDWFDDFFDEEVTVKKVRHRRPTLRLGTQTELSRRRPKSRRKNRLSNSSLELLTKSAPNSQLAERLGVRTPARHQEATPARPSLIRKLTPASRPAAISENPLLGSPGSRKLNRVQPKAALLTVSTITAKVQAPKAAALTKAEPTEAVVPEAKLREPVGLKRIAPRQDALSEKRRRRLNRLVHDVTCHRVEASAIEQHSVTEVAPAEHMSPVVEVAACNDQAVVAASFVPPTSDPIVNDVRAAKAMKPTADAAENSGRAVSSGDKHRKRTRRPKTSSPQPAAHPDKKKIAAATAIVEQSDDLDNADNESDMAGSYRVIEPPPPVEESYAHWFQRVVVRNRVMTWFAAFYVHWMILLLMAVIVVHGPENTARLLLNATIADDEPRELPPMEIVPAIAEPLPVDDVAEIPVIEESSVAELSEQNIAIDESLLATLTEQTSEATAPSETRSERNSRNQQQESQSPPIPNPAPTQAVSAGSFSVWTEPTQPSAGDPYHIIIQIRLPEGVDRYDVSDLQGIVVGSDGYRKPIPGSASGGLFINDRYARFIVPIVSADAEVNDTIFIKSRMLKETQKITLAF